MNGKYSEAIGAFWGASFFVGLLMTTLIGFNGNNWIMAGVIGLCIFLILGLSIQGIITLARKNENK